MKNKKFTDYLIRYSIATLGLALVAAGVALSIKSALGTAPLSCLPYILSMWGGFTVGEYTIMMHFLFILIQIILLRKNFKAEYLMQLIPTFLFGYLCDFFLWTFDFIALESFGAKTAVLILSCLVTALGTSIEVLPKAWMLAGEMTDAVISDVTGAKFSNVKIAFDVSLVIISAIVSYLIFGNALGSSEDTGFLRNIMAETEGIAIGLGTLVSAFLIGGAMKATDPVAKAIFGKTVERHS